MSSLFASTRNTRPLPGCGYRYIRSDAPRNMTDPEVEWLRSHGVTTVVDLRREREWKKHPCRLEQEEGFTYYHYPMSEGAEAPKTPEEVPLSYLSMRGETLDRVVDTLMGAKTNTLFFCNAGKDRTGVVSATILKKLGIPDEIIVEDYMLTRDNLLEELTAYAASHPEVDLKVLTPKEENIRRLLEISEDPLRSEKD